MKFLEKIENEYKNQVEAIRSSYENIINAHFEDMWISQKLDKYNWLDDVEQLLEWSMWEASENDCKKEIIKNYINYLDSNDKEIFNQNWIIDFWRNYISNCILKYKE